VKLAKVVTPVALDIDQGFPVTVGVSQTLAYGAEVHFHVAIPRSGKILKPV
jgi:hypothetical protein